MHCHGCYFLKIFGLPAAHRTHPYPSLRVRRWHVFRTFITSVPDGDGGGGGEVAASASSRFALLRPPLPACDYSPAFTSTEGSGESTAAEFLRAAAVAIHKGATNATTAEVAATVPVERLCENDDDIEFEVGGDDNSGGSGGGWLAPLLPAEVWLPPAAAEASFQAILANLVLPGSFRGALQTS